MRICAIGLHSGHISPLPVWPCPPDPHQHSLSIHLLPTHIYFTLLHPPLLSSRSPPSPPIWPSEAGGGRRKQMRMSFLSEKLIRKNFKKLQMNKNEWLKQLVTKRWNKSQTGDMTIMTLKANSTEPWCILGQHELDRFDWCMKEEFPGIYKNLTNAFSFPGWPFCWALWLLQCRLNCAISRNLA